MNSEKASYFFWLFCGLLLLEESYRLNIGVLRRPGPGLFPFLIGIIIVVFSFILLVQSPLNKFEKEEKKGKVNYRNLILCLISLYAYSLIFEWLGFIPSTFLLIIFLIRFMGIEKRGWILIIMAAFLITTLSYALFKIWLHAALPKGIFGI